jgi:cyclophilin family peptidyl-prolyl cis-trans isomerase
MKAPRVEIMTSLGRIEVELYAQHAPKTVENFKGLVSKGYYDNTIVRSLT